MYLSTKNSLLTLLVATTFLTGCQEDTANDTQTSSLSLAPKVKTTLPPGLEKKIVEETQPVAEETLPIVEETQPIVEETLPIVEETQPIAEETLPIVEETQPVAEETLPIVEETQPIVEETQPIAAMCIEGDAKIEGHVTDKATGAGLPDVQVNVGGCSTTTDAQGFYTLANIAETEEAIVNFEKDGYLFGSTKIQVKELSGDNTSSPNYLEVSLNAYASWNPWSYDSQIGATGGAVEAPASIYTDVTGNVYNGTVYGSWMFEDTMEANGRDTFPGAFEGRDNNGIVVPFVSYGLMSLELKDENGNPLNITQNITLVLASSTGAAVTGTTESILPLWYYDYDQGLWIEEGYAERQTDGTYRGEISHPGTWSLSKPIENGTGIYRGRILNEDGTPARDVRIHALGENWVISDLSTDADGNFEVEVIPDSSFQLAAYNYKDKYEAMYNNTIPAIASGDIVED